MKNIFDNIPNHFHEELFAELHRARGVVIERIVSYGQSSPEGFWYDQNENEWILLLEGKAGILLENDMQVKEMNPGDYMNIPAHVKHRVVWTDKTHRTIWLAVYYDSTF
jgi:cupin 2 domain-containing protein